MGSQCIIFVFYVCLYFIFVKLKWRSNKSVNNDDDDDDDDDDTNNNYENALFKLKNRSVNSV